MSSLSSSSARSSSSDKYLNYQKHGDLQTDENAYKCLNIENEPNWLTHEEPWNRYLHHTRCPPDSPRLFHRQNRAKIRLVPPPPILRPNQSRNWTIAENRRISLSNKIWKLNVTSIIEIRDSNVKRRMIDKSRNKCKTRCVMDLQIIYRNAIKGSNRFFIENFFCHW